MKPIIKRFMKHHRIALGRAMWQWRLAQGKPRKPLGVREAAARAGLSAATWCRMERGDFRCHADSLMAVYGLLALEDWSRLVSTIARYA